MEIQRAILCCKPYHARRSLLYYQLLYPDTRFLVCPVKESDVTRENWFLTEKGTKIVLGEIERIGVQFHEIMREMREADGAEKTLQNDRSGPGGFFFGKDFPCPLKG